MVGRPGHRSERVAGREDDGSWLRALAETVIPPLGNPGGWKGGLETLVVREPAELEADLATARHLIERLDRAAVGIGEASFNRARSEVRAQLLAEADSDPELAAAVQSAISLVRRGFYAGTPQGPRPYGWSIVGFSPPTQDSVEPLRYDERSIDAADLRTRYDVIVVGAGVGGLAVASRLADTGLDVLVVERGQAHSDQDLYGDQLRGKRPGIYHPLVGPGDGHPRVLLKDGFEQVVTAERGGFAWGLNAMCAGGGSRLWQAMAWRFLPEDFLMSSTYDFSDEASVADWPIEYSDLRPYYEQAENVLGLSGDSLAPTTARYPGGIDYAMPALADTALTPIFRQAARDLGWNVGAVPFAINSIPHDGRASCIRCPLCKGHACPVNAKNGTHNTFLRHVPQDANLSILFGSQVLRLTNSGSDGGSSVELISASGPDPSHHRVRCGTVVVAAGAVETPRLLLTSGVGNEWVGRNLHNHVVATYLGVIRDDVDTRIGPGHSVATLDFAHRNAANFGGGIVFDLSAIPPFSLASYSRLFGIPEWGGNHLRWMQTDGARIVGTMAIGHDLPSIHSRVSLAKSVQDRWGTPVAALHYVPSRESIGNAAFLQDRCKEWLSATGAQAMTPAGLPVGAIPVTEHASGTCRMGDDPSNSACDRFGQLHGWPGVYVADASLHPSNGSVNPALTIIANSLRIADAIITSGR